MLQALKVEEILSDRKADSIARWLFQSVLSLCVAELATCHDQTISLTKRELLLGGPAQKPPKFQIGVFTEKSGQTCRAKVWLKKKMTAK